MLQGFVNGIVFFNGGKKSGASQPHKHIQCIPLENVFSQSQPQQEFGIFKIFNSFINTEDGKNDFFEKVESIKFNIDGYKNNSHDVYSIGSGNKDKKNLIEFFDVWKIKKFEENAIPHLFVNLTKLPSYFDKQKFEDILADDFQEYAKIVYCIYLNVLLNLNLISSNSVIIDSSSNRYDRKNNKISTEMNGKLSELRGNIFDYCLLEEREKIFTDYSFLYTKDWLYVIPRKTDCVEMKNGSLFLNSNSYTFSILIKSEELEKEIEEVDIIKDIYTKL